MQFEQTNSDFLRVVARELKELHAIAKTIPQRRPANLSSYRWHSMESIKGLVHARRSEMKRMSLQDPLFLREQEYKKLGNNRMADYEYYQDPNTGQIAVYPTEDHNWQGNYRRFNTLPFGIPEESRIGGENTIYFNPVIHWKDDFLEKVRKGDYGSIHDRINHFRIDGKFYDWDNYFKYDNQAWNKANWALNNGKLVDLSKSIKIVCNLGNIGIVNKIITEYMSAPQGDHFVNALQEMNEKKEKAFIGFKLWYGDFPVSLMGKNFLHTLFKNGNSRYCISQENQDYLMLSKRQLEDCDLVSSKEHREMIETMLDNYAKESIYDEITTREDKKEKARKVFMSEMRFRIVFVDSEIASSKGIKEQIWKEVFNEGRSYNLTELKQRLSIARALLKEEKNYAGHNK